ncbi:MAG: hypothetical protein R3F43_01165 [bacterium]
MAHFNHPRELTPEAAAAAAALVEAGVVVLNQAVLLRGISDDAATLAALFTGLLDWGAALLPAPPRPDGGDGALPGEPGRGAGHRAGAAGAGDGAGWPTYVLEIPGGGGKVPVDSHYVRPTSTPGIWHLESPLDGAVHVYRDPAVLS